MKKRSILVYVSILKRSVTPLLGVRRGFENTSYLFQKEG